MFERFSGGRIFEVDFRTVKISFKRPPHSISKVGIDFGVSFWRGRGVPFGPPFSALAARFLKTRNVSRYYKYKHSRAFGHSKRSFFERVKRIDFDIENCLKRYVYSGFSDFAFSSKSVIRGEKRHFLVQFCVRPKIAQTLRI